MSVTYGFYNSVGSDRRYDSTQISKLFDGLINDGVFASIGTRLIPVPSTPPSMDIVVGEGRAWFNHTWTLNDSELILTVDAPHVTLNRIDAVVLEVDASEAVRANSIKIVKGTPASSPVPPEMTHTTFVNQYALAYISVPVGVSAITNTHISVLVGSAPCPFVTGVVQDFDMTPLITQWSEEFSDWRDAEQAAFILWFETIEGILTGDLAGALQAQIDVFRKVLTANRTYYVRTDGNDLNTGLVNDAGGAFLTIQKAIDTACALDIRGYNVTINIGAGTYTNPVVLKPVFGWGRIILSGSSTVIHTTNANCISTYNFTGMYFTRFGSGGVYDISGIKLEMADTGAGSGLLVGGGFVVTIDNVEFGFCRSNHIVISDGGTVIVGSNGYTVSGDVHYLDHCIVSNNAHFLMNGCTVNITNNPIQISGYWIESSLCSIVIVTGVTFTNKAYVETIRYRVNKNGVIDTGGGGETYLPGTIAGSVATGGQYV